MKRVCLKDVAEAAGVSAVTASIVLNSGSTRSRARVGAARQEEIRRIAAELGYRASAAARILKCKELNDIGLLFFENAQNIREHVGFTDLNIQFTRTCRELGIRCQVDWFDSLHHPHELPGLLTDGLVGGLLIAGNPNGESERFLREQCRMPFVRIEEPGNTRSCSTLLRRCVKRSNTWPRQAIAGSASSTVRHAFNATGTSAGSSPPRRPGSAWSPRRSSTTKPSRTKISQSMRCWLNGGSWTAENLPMRFWSAAPCSARRS